MNNHITNEVGFKITTKIKSINQPEFILHDVIKKYNNLNKEANYDDDDDSSGSSDDSDD